jgi:beta-ureidopropionase / N-carbamoyl-L-amino-acid hydrolase
MTLDVDAERLAADWETLSTFRDEAQPGWTRRPFTQPYLAARAWLTERMRDAGLATEVDAGGNLFGRRRGSDSSLPPILLGSHTDTVAGGGRFDGMVGVLAAIEVARTLRGVALKRPLEVVDFLAEEPTDFGISTVGSRALAGTLTREMLARQSGSWTLADALALVGGRPDAIETVRRSQGSVAVYFELHVEQGPVLESEGLRLGVVTGITGIQRFRLAIEGRPDHAGTMPMSRRRDALAAAAEIVLALEDLWRDGRGVGTVGRLSLAPNATNVVPGSVELWAEMRSVVPEVLEQRAHTFASAARDLAARRDVQVQVDQISAEAPVAVSQGVQDLLDGVLVELGQPVKHLPSFAGHDANQIARFAPIGMLFMPSRDGRSHCPEEWTDLADVALGARALGQAVLSFDGRSLELRASG